MFTWFKNFLEQEHSMRMARAYREGHRYASSALLNGMAPAVVIEHVSSHRPEYPDDYFESLLRGAQTAVGQFKEALSGARA